MTPDSAERWTEVIRGEDVCEGDVIWRDDGWVTVTVRVASSVPVQTVAVPYVVMGWSALIVVPQLVRSLGWTSRNVRLVRMSRTPQLIS